MEKYMISTKHIYLMGYSNYAFDNDLIKRTSKLSSVEDLLKKNYYIPIKRVEDRYVEMITNTEFYLQAFDEEELRKIFLNAHDLEELYNDKKPFVSSDNSIRFMEYSLIEYDEKLIIDDKDIKTVTSKLKKIYSKNSNSYGFKMKSLNKKHNKIKVKR